MNLDIQQMQTFLTVVREQNFRRAAKVLNVSQPTVTMRIKTLEQNIGSTLLKRHGNYLTLTPSGETLMKYASKMLYVLQEVKDHLSSIPASTNRFSIAVIPSFTTYVFPRMLQPTNSKDKPQYTVQSVSSTKVYQLILDDAVDFGVMRGPVKINNEIKSRLLYREKIYLALPVNHPLNDKDFIYMKDLLNENIITYRRRFWSLFSSKILECGGKFEPKMMVDSDITAKRFVQNNLGVTLLPENSIRKTDLEFLACKPIEDFHINRDAYCVYKREGSQRLVEEFQAWVQTSLQNDKKETRLLV
ncbi:LysR family transcriptional regulator [Halalkalibacterium ligniniphilum]|uniref:LysR family transcriptional regulator n=1 Tax=Halalkalibacterium ligniniphilum TaxID=1134413 RepID=UPI000346C394|nr:LysR family transcriptional regulator [Halalkalibacterium ligniniphilum]